jgi:hypothetical protein
MAHCEVPYKQGWTKGTNCHSWCFRTQISPVGITNAIAECLGNQFTPHAVCDETHERRLEVKLYLKPKKTIPWKRQGDVTC